MEKELKYSEKLLRECRDLSDVFLGPILSKRELSRRVKGCSPTLRKLATYIDYPALMQKAFEREDFEEVVAMFAKLFEHLRFPVSVGGQGFSASRVLRAVQDQSMAVWAGTFLFPIQCSQDSF